MNFYVRGYDANWICQFEMCFRTSKAAEKFQEKAEGDPNREYNYRVELELSPLQY